MNYLHLYGLALFIICINAQCPLPKRFKAGSEAHQAPVTLEWDIFSKDKITIKPVDKNGISQPGWFGLYVKESNGDYVRAVTYGDDIIRSDRIYPYQKLIEWDLMIGDQNEYRTFVVIFQPGRKVKGKFIPNGSLLRRSKERSLRKAPIMSMITFVIIIVAVVVGFCVCNWIILLVCLVNRHGRQRRREVMEAQFAHGAILV